MSTAEKQLRQRHQAKSQSSGGDEDGNANNGNNFANRSRNESVTELPCFQENGERATERTEIPSPRNFNDNNDNDHDNNATGAAAVRFSRLDSSDAYPSSDRISSQAEGEEEDNDSDQALQSSNSNSNSKNKSQGQVAKAEGKKGKIVTRVVSGAAMIAFFLGMTYMGHTYICLLVAMVELLLFRELVKVRYNNYFHTIQDTIPLFRTTQWLWFAVAIFYTYGDFIREIVIQGNPDYHIFQGYVHFIPSLSFLLYSGTFVMTIATMQVGHIKFQLNQLCWTIVVLCLTVGQLKYIMHNIFNGLFWFALPILLVVTNDIMAYVSGMTCGRKFIRRKFISFSPNKTWEGFIGGWIFTMIAAWYISKGLAQFPWMYCPTNKFTLAPASLTCVPDPIFVHSQMRFPSQYFDLLPRYISKLIPNVVEICSDGTSVSPPTVVVNNLVEAAGIDSTLFLTPCVSGNKSHMHHHFELIVNVYPVQMHALVLALFASLVAPFGGFLASAIKRAYHLKDFDSLIPGHGGVMDRMDCQFLMALCTWVHYNTFVKIATISVPKLTYMYNQLSDLEKKTFLESVSLAATGKRGGRIRLEDYGL